MSGTGHTARAAALSLLARRPRTTKDLEVRLERKGFDAAQVVATLSDLSRLGLVDDVAFARAWARGQAERRLLGPRAVRAGLIRQGVTTAMADDVVRELYAEIDERRLARQVADRSGTDRDSATRRRLHDRLARRGFSSDVIQGALRLTGDEREDERA